MNHYVRRYLLELVREWDKQPHYLMPYEKYEQHTRQIDKLVDAVFYG